MQRSLKFISFLLLITVVLFTGGCAGKEQAPLKIKLGMLPIADNLPFWVAEEKGYFKEAGLDVELVPFPSALERDSAFAAKQIDGAVGDLLAVAAMQNSGTKVKAVAVAQGITPGENRFGILSAPNSGIKKVVQLKNVPIAMSLNTINEFITDGLLLSAGFNQDEIKKTAIPKLPVRLDALLNGTVKAAVLPDPFATLAEQRGANLVLDNTKNTVSPTVLMVRQEALDKNLAGIKKLMQAYTKAVSDIQSKPEQFDNILVEKARVPKQLLDNKENKLKFHFSQPVLPAAQDVEKVVKWMVDHKLLKSNLSYQDLVDARVLEK